MDPIAATVVVSIAFTVVFAGIVAVALGNGR